MAENDVEAQRYLRGLNKRVFGIATDIHELILSHQCKSYVKTSYVGYEIDGGIVAALYGYHPDHVEIALALDSAHASKLLVNAARLTWRTMPVAAVVRVTEDLAELSVLVAEACERVRLGQQDINQDNEEFIKSRLERFGETSPRWPRSRRLRHPNGGVQI